MKKQPLRNNISYGVLLYLDFIFYISLCKWYRISRESSETTCLR